MLRVYTYELPFRNPFVTSKGTFTFRNGLVLEYTFGKHSAVAEVAPLPGFSSTDFDSVQHEILKMYDSLSNTLDRISNYFSQSNLVPLNISGFSRPIRFKDMEVSPINFNSWPAGIQAIELVREISAKHIDGFQRLLTPELHFAIDSIILQLYLQHFDGPELKSVVHIPINCTINSIESACVGYDLGFRTFKIKVGLDLEKELNLIDDVRRNFEDVHIRLDANGAWNPDIAMIALKSLQPYNIQYIEQPVDRDMLSTYGMRLRSLGTPIAADESARDLSSISALIDNKSTDVLILKPTLTGSFGNLIDITETARIHGQSCVFTSTLDAVINRKLTAYLVSVLSDLKYAQGLATGQLLESDLVSLPDKIENGHLIHTTEEIVNLADSVQYERLVRIR